MSRSNLDMATGPSGIRVRFPPSPTGWCHVGTARMAIINLLFARKNNGAVIFRSEDTDKERSAREFEEDIIDCLHWLGLNWDEFHRQSERMELHREHLHSLIDSGRAYVSEEESKREPGKMAKVVRLRNPETKITFNDLIRGDITFDTAELGDFVIARSIDDPLYHFAVVADDADMEITHIIRGEDHISNTPRQILLQEALGFKRPLYAHYPLLLGSDKSKLSKRTGDVAVKSYRESGYLPEALLNYISILGWTPKSEREVMTLSEMTEEFDIKDLHKSGAVFDMEKLRWFNRQYMHKISLEEFAKNALGILESSIRDGGIAWNESVGKSILNLVRERIYVWEDIKNLVSSGEFNFFFAEPELVTQEIPEKKSNAAEAARHLTESKEMLSNISNESFNEPSKIKSTMWDYAEKEGRGAVLWPLRYSLTGRKQSPDPFLVASIIGKEAVLRRISEAVEKLRTS